MMMVGYSYDAQVKIARRKKVLCLLLQFKTILPQLLSGSFTVGSFVGKLKSCRGCWYMNLPAASSPESNGVIKVMMTSEVLN